MSMFVCNQKAKRKCLFIPSILLEVTVNSQTIVNTWSRCFALVCLRMLWQKITVLGTTPAKAGMRLDSKWASTPHHTHTNTAIEKFSETAPWLNYKCKGSALRETGSELWVTGLNEFRSYAGHAIGKRLNTWNSISFYHVTGILEMLTKDTLL